MSWRVDILLIIQNTGGRVQVTLFIAFTDVGINLNRIKFRKKLIKIWLS